MSSLSKHTLLLQRRRDAALELRLAHRFGNKLPDDVVKDFATIVEATNRLETAIESMSQFREGSRSYKRARKEVDQALAEIRRTVVRHLP
jgi:small-conductance mechanosensitive channel